jgi:uncharacterized membrane protein YjjP (DUF1212 family)
MVFSKIKSASFNNGNNSSFASHRCEYLLCLALDVGEGILKNGGEISRVEDTVSRICRAYGAIHVEVFAIPSVIIASIRMADGEYSSQTRRVYGSENNLSKIEAYSDISYNVCKNCPPLEELDEMIRNQKRKKTLPFAIVFLGYMLASGSFAVFFGGSLRDGIVGALIGAVFALLEGTSLGRINQLARTALESFVGGMMAHLSVLAGLGQNVDFIMIGTVMLLIPGVAFGTALRDLLYGEFLAGSIKMVQVVLIALMIAFGYLLSSFVMGGVV